MAAGKSELRELARQIDLRGADLPDSADLVAFVAQNLPQGKFLASYSAIGSEIATEPVNSALDRVVFPTVEAGSERLTWRQGPPTVISSLGFSQPAQNKPTVEVSNIGLVLVPGLLFTMTGQRLGRGGGFYDRFLEDLTPDILTIGMPMSSDHIVEELSVETHDVSVTHLFLGGQVVVVESA